MSIFGLQISLMQSMTITKSWPFARPLTFDRDSTSDLRLADPSGPVNTISRACKN